MGIVQERKSEENGRMQSLRGLCADRWGGKRFCFQRVFKQETVRVYDGIGIVAGDLQQCGENEINIMPVSCWGARLSPLRVIARARLRPWQSPEGMC